MFQAPVMYNEDADLLSDFFVSSYSWFYSRKHDKSTKKKKKGSGNREVQDLCFFQRLYGTHYLVVPSFLSGGNWDNIEFCRNNMRSRGPER